jgi:spermidine/putrescine transport system permease protein
MSYKTFRKGLAIPFSMFLVLFIILPMLFICYYAFTDESGVFTAQACVSFFTNPTKLNVLFVSLLFATITTILCLLIGFPIAWILADSKLNHSNVLIMLFVVPMWINFVLRTGALRDLLNTMLGWVGKSTGELPYLSAIIGLVADYLPFTIIPLNTTLLKLDHSQIEVAEDLGCNKFHTFTRNIIPQAMPGLVSASMMVFMPSMSSYVVTDVMSEHQVTVVGNAIEVAFGQSDWADGSFMALIMLVLIFIGMMATGKYMKQSEKEGRGQW